MRKAIHRKAVAGPPEFFSATVKPMVVCIGT